MNLRELWKPVLLYTGLLGLLTVGTIYIATHSLLYVLLLTAGGLLLAVLNGGTAGRTSLGGAENADRGETEFEESGLVPQANTGTPFRFNLLLYGLGVVLWSLVVLTTLRDTLA